MTSRDSRLERLFEIWRELRRQGREVSASELCKDDPDLLAEVTQLLETVDFGAVRSDPSGDMEVGSELPRSIGRYAIHGRLGSGSFGIVYRGFDPQLDRWVAVKLPHAERFESPQSRDDFLKEARQAAQLDHSNIVPVYDAGVADGICYIVYKIIDGCSLGQYVRGHSLDWATAARIFAEIAEALGHAHERGIYHRDVKPSNILMDRRGTPYLSDLGLAVHEADLAQQRRGRAGTLPYMSPEQVRGEGHRIDGRTDVYSLGVVLYEVLTRRRPFEADSSQALTDEILHHEPRPPRQQDRSIPRELEQICLRAMSKRVADRYTTAIDMANDLREAIRLGSQPNLSETAHALQTDPAKVARADSTHRDAGRPFRVIPRGLRPFGEEDRDFFLDLLPGPRNLEGLPDSVHFWLRRLESRELAHAFRVGLIYGPSGCGKSSLVRAGLLPRLPEWVHSVYVEATREDTERQLKSALCRWRSTLDPQTPLAEMLAQVRRSPPAGSRHKLVLVVDQFEQWLHSHEHDEQAELVLALRQCDGANVQCILLARDDFWLALSRFMRSIEVPLVEGHNIALVDLFSPEHARRVLAAFGQAFGRLPNDGGELTAEQSAFLNQAVAQLSRGSEVIPVQLSLVAMMLRAKPWEPATLRDVGGVAGIGVRFLDESFVARGANPEHRSYKDLARTLLGVLLPERGTDIRGNLTPRRDLAEACRIALDSPSFQRLLEILDTELHIITPAESTSQNVPGAAPAGEAPPVLGYQLAHDYLVAPLRQWLTRERRQTWRGRSELLLEERAREWESHRDRRHLPSLLEYLSIAAGTNRRRARPEERAIFAAATRHHCTRSLVCIASVVLLVSAFLFVRMQFAKTQEAYAQNLVVHLLAATPESVPAIAREMQSCWSRVQPRLEQLLARGQLTPRQHVYVSAALLPRQPDQLTYLKERALEVGPEDLALIRRALRPFRGDVVEKLRAAVVDENLSPARRLRSLALLIELDSTHPSWAAMGNEAARWLADEPSSSLSTWIAIFQPAHGWLSEAFASALAQPHPPSDASREQHDAWERRTARVATALLLLGNPSEVWPHLEFHDDPGLRTRLIHSLAGELKNPEILVRKLDEPSSSAPLRRALIWALGLYSPDDLTPPLREEVRTKVLKAFREDADPGVHGAALWLLGMWGAGTEIERAEEELAGREPTAERRWFVNRQGMTFAVLDIPHPLAARPPDDSSDPGVPPPPSPGDSRRVALDMTEVTFEQFLRFDPAHTERQTPTQADVPALMISPYDAMRYCNWLSGVEGIRSEEYCYQPVAGTDSLAPHAEFWSKAGYRLPTDAEWTYACRAGTVTDRYFGTSEEWLARYVSCTATSLDSPSPVALRIPNDSGFFDMLGNAGEWCHVLGDGALKNARQPDTVLAGGSYRQAASIARALGRSSSDPTRFVISGFRVVRTLQ